MTTNLNADPRYFAQLETNPLTVDVTQAARILGVGAEWLSRQARAGRVPHTRMGRTRRFTEEHLAAILDQHEASLAAALPEPARPVLAAVPAPGVPADPWAAARRTRGTRSSTPTPRDVAAAMSRHPSARAR